METDAENGLRLVEPAERILLLPHCLRRTETCQAKYTRQGLQCLECNPDCPINQLRGAALRLGYKGVCIAPGGALALNYVKEKKPLGIVAVACDKELEAGVRGVRESGIELAPIPIIIVPLARDGCVDTEVDIDLALEKIAIGCPLPEESTVV